MDDMENGNEKWLEQLKDSLKDYREPVPPSVKEKLEKEWREPGKTVFFIFLRRAASVAAALFLLAFSVKWLLGPQQEPVRVAEPEKDRPEWLTENKNTEPLSSRQYDLSRTPKENPGNRETRPQADRMQELSGAEKESGENVKNWTNVSLQEKIVEETEEKYIHVTKDTTTIRENKEEPAAEQVGADVMQAREEAAEADAASREESKDGKKRGRVAGRYKKIRVVDASPADSKRGEGGSGWQTGLAVANSGVSSKSSPGGGGGLPNSSVMNSPNDFTAVPSDLKVVFFNGSPYLDNEKTFSYKHKQPLSFGLYIGRSVTPRVSIETGLVYTLLMSDVTDNTGAGFRQTLHFLGIPVRANWSFLERKNFSLYLGAGGMLEKCVSGTLGREKVSMKEWQYSVFAAPGIQYNLGGRFNIYFEPGAAYFFDNKSDIRTIRQDSPLNFTLQLGFRLAY